MEQLLLVNAGYVSGSTLHKFLEAGRGYATWAEGRKGGGGQDLGCPPLCQEDGGIADVTPARWMEVVASWQTEYLLGMDKIKKIILILLTDLFTLKRCWK